MSVASDRRGPVISRPATARPALSVTGITQNSGDRLEHWITRAREYADEVGLLVDESSTDDTYDLAREHADSVRLVEHPPYIEVYYDLALRHAGGEWILWLDDDELMNVGFAGSRDEMLSDRFVTHFLLPYRWVIPAAAVEPGQEGFRWLSSFPWHPDP
ncbi:MAG TPA: glycosyltransferase, partial [Frankiaceae bacterium]|nr:glycosyltransferase [Frankiaceae bacterium]